MYCYRTTSTITSTTSGPLTTCTPSSRVDQFREVRSLKRERQSVFFFFSEKRTWCTPIRIWKKFNSIWINPESRCTKILGEFTKKKSKKVLFEACSEKRIAVLSHTIRRNCSSQHTTCDMYWESGIHEDWRGFILQSFPKGYRESYSRQICNMDVRILLIPKRQNPPTIKANKARSTRKLVARISGIHVASIPEKVSDGSTGKIVAVPLITAFQVYFTQQFRKKTRIAGKQYKNWFNSSRITRSVTRSYRIWTGLRNWIRSARSRRSWSPAWVTRTTSSCARSLLKNNALILLYIRKLASKTAPAANACSRRKGIDSWPRKDTTSCQSPATLSKKKKNLPMEPDMDHLCGSACITKNKKSQKGEAVRVFHSRKRDVANQDLEEVQYDLDKPRIAVNRILGEFKKKSFLVQFEARSEKRIAVLSNSKSRNCSFQHTTCDMYKKLFFMKIGEDLYCKVYQSPRLRRGVLTPKLQHGRQDPFLIPERENPPTIKANKARSARKLVARISVAHVASIPEKVSDGSTGKIVAVTLITAFQV